MLPHQIDARLKGIPVLGVGLIYPILEPEFVVDPFPILNYWPKVNALDVGWNKTAAVWGRSMSRPTRFTFTTSTIKTSA
jgi:hypothetical protein